jgi:outer membrane protein TolC
LRVESAVAGAEATLAEANAQRATAEVRLRTLLHLRDSEPLTTRDAVRPPVESVVRTQSASLDDAYRKLLGSNPDDGNNVRIERAA